MAYKRYNNPKGTVKGDWSDASAFNTELALKESQRWIEAVTKKRFPSSDFVKSTRDGRLLCMLVNCIKPGIVKKINSSKTPLHQRENIGFFIQACKELGLRETQVFTSNDLFEGQRIRTVAIALYWLGRYQNNGVAKQKELTRIRAARATPTYKGPQLNVAKFANMTCKRCKGKILPNDDYVLTMDSQWHTRCAKCDNCSAPIKKDGYYADKGKIYCPPCWEGNKIPHGHGHGHGHPHSHGHGHPHHHDHGVTGKGMHNPCDTCHKPIKGKFANVGGKKICEDCLCDNCNHPFDPPNDIKVKDGKRLCKHCRCSDCDVPLYKGFVEQPKGSGNKKCLDCANKKPTTCRHIGCNAPVKPSKRYCPRHEDDHMCHKCHEPFTPGKPITNANGKKYHPNCYVCDDCHGPFVGGKVHPHGPNKLCTPCHDKSHKGHKHNHGPHPGGAHNHGNPGPGLSEGPGYVEDVTPCAACKKPLNGLVTNVYDNYFHKGCFKCTDCKKPFNQGYFPFAKMPYCEPCYHRVSGSDKCNKCGKVATGNVVKFRNNIFHPQCFTCQMCGTNMKNGGQIYNVNNAPTCGSCKNAIAPAPTHSRMVRDPGVKRETVITGPRKVGMTYNPWKNETVYRGARGEKVNKFGYLGTCKGCKRGINKGDKYCGHCGERAV